MISYEEMCEMTVINGLTRIIRGGISGKVKMLIPLTEKNINRVTEPFQKASRMSLFPFRYPEIREIILETFRETRNAFR